MENTMNKTIYAIPNYECDLNCPHCEVHTYQNFEYYHGKFINQIQQFSSSDVVILFGGEPTLHFNRFVDILKTNKISSISTNLVNVDNRFFNLLNLYPKISIATSWNINRFSPDQYIKWLNNLRNLAKINRPCMVLITMTEDLILSDHSYKTLFKCLQDIQDTNGANKILFEHYVGEYATQEYNEKCDNWLCRVHADWKFNLINDIENKVLNWNCDCKNTYTLEPNGNFRLGCPQKTSVGKFLVECLTCEYSDKCQPCILQKSCSFPKKLFKLISNEYTSINR